MYTNTANSAARLSRRNGRPSKYTVAAETATATKLENRTAKALSRKTSSDRALSQYPSGGFSK